MMAKRLTKAEQGARDAHFAEFPFCWMSHFLGRRQVGRTELHHIAGRGKGSEVRENFCALSSDMHRAIQSRQNAELICLVLKKHYDPKHYSPKTICSLRGRAETCWTENDVIYCESTMRTMEALV